MPVRTTVPIGSMTLTATESAVLGLLSSGERSGYDLARKAEQSVGHVWSPARSQIYAVLPRLVKGGLARSRKVAQSGRPDKQVYRITRRGRKELRHWLEASEDRDDTFLLRVFFGELMSREALVSLVDRRRGLSRVRLREYSEIEQRGPDFHPYLTLRWGFAYERALIRWADEVLRELESVQGA